MKPLHSNTCLPYSSFVPTSRKRALLIGEKHRNLRNSSPFNIKVGENILKRRFQANEYPNDFIDKHFCDHRWTSTSDENGSIEIVRPYLKLPYYGEEPRHEILSLARKTGMIDSIRLIFETETPLSRRFRTVRHGNVCCNLRYVIYRLHCLQCSSNYIGETKRTIRSRVSEHMRSPNSAFYRHMLDFHKEASNENNTKIFLKAKEK